MGWVIPDVTSGDDTPVVKWGLPGQFRPVRVAGQAEGNRSWDICQVGPRKRGARGPPFCGSPILLALFMFTSLSVPCGPPIMLLGQFPTVLASLSLSLVCPIPVPTS